MSDIVTVNDHLNELESELGRLRNSVNEIATAREAASKVISASQSMLTSLKQVATDFQHLGKSNKSITQKLDETVDSILKVDFPSRLDKLDNTVSAINIGIQNLSTNLHDQARKLEEANEQIGSLHSALKIHRRIMLAILVLLAGGAIATVLYIITTAGM